MPKTLLVILHFLSAIALASIASLCFSSPNKYHVVTGLALFLAALYFLFVGIGKIYSAEKKVNGK